MIVLVFGTRPEAIKMGPVAAALRDLDADFQIICSGQHTELLQGTPAENDLWPAHSLGLKSGGNVTRWVERAITPFRRAYRETNASLIVVQGDTMTALAAARAAKQSALPIAHIEAGVRSGNLEEPWPEEGFRREITTLATHHYAATSQAFANLMAEAVPMCHIRVTGNPVVSALHRYTDAKAHDPEPQILITMHRREWLDRGDVLGVANAFSQAAQNHPNITFLWPVHPGVAPRLIGPTWSPNLQLIPPLPYRGMIGFLSLSQGLLTDSGGLVEEAATLGIPTAILRNANDRPEAVEARIAVQQPPTPEGVRSGLKTILCHHLNRRPSSVFGQPDSASQIAQHLASLS